MNYDIELEKAIELANIDIYEKEIKSELEKKEKNKNVNNTINEIWNEVADKKIAIATAGVTTNELLNVLDGDMSNLVCIIDKYNNGFKLKGYDVISYDDVKNYDIEVVFNSSVGFPKEIKEELGKIIKDCKFIMLQDELKRRGCTFKGNFFEENLNYKYVKLNYIFMEYCEKKSEKYLVSLIYNYLRIRDIRNALYYINIYLKLYKDIKNRMYDLQNKIINIIDSMKNDFLEKNKKFKTKFILICDSLRYRDVYELNNMKKLKQRAEKGIIIKNAFTHVPYTTGSLMTLFTGREYLDDNIYNETTLSDDEEIFKEIDRLDYDFKYSGCRTRLFSNKYSIPNTNTNMSQMMWNGLCKVLNSDKNTLYCFHFMESHTPFFCGVNREKLIEFSPFWLGKIDINDIKNEKVQHNNSLKYMDEQIDFFMDIIGDKSEVILFADHGFIIQSDKLMDENTYYCDDCIRIPYMVLNTKQNYVYNDLFSHLDTKNFIINFLNDIDLFYKIKKREYIEANRDFTYNEECLEAAKKNKLLDLGKAFKCFRTQDYKLVVFSDGSEKYYSICEGKECEHFDSSKVTYIKNMVNLKFPMWDCEKYKSAIKFYKIVCS